MRERVAWSHSVLNSFDTCERRHHEVKVLKNFIEPEGEQLKWGNEVHRAVFKYMKFGDDLPDNMKQYQQILDQVRDTPGEKFAEQQLALTRDFKQCAWFDPKTWVRAIIDYGIKRDGLFIALDWKTGKPKPDSDQLKLFAGVVFCIHPDVHTVRTGFVWLGDNQITSETYKRQELPEIWNTFLPLVKRLESAFEKDQWNPKPSGLCRAWCPVTSCEFHGKGSR